jgi:hypothetical protein
VSRLPRASAASDGGTSLIGAANLSPVTKFVAGTGAVSRYNLSRSQKSVTVQDLFCEQVRVSGCNYRYKFVLSAGAKAKSVTNNLPILSVLALVIYFCRVKDVCLSLLAE